MLGGYGIAGGKHGAVREHPGGQRRITAGNFHTHGLQQFLGADREGLLNNRLILHRHVHCRGIGFVIAVAIVRDILGIRVKSHGPSGLQGSVLIGNPEITAVTEAGAPAVPGPPGTLAHRGQSGQEVVPGIVVVPAHQQYVVVGSGIGAVERSSGGDISHLAASDGNNLVEILLLGHIDADLDRAVIHDLLLQQVRVRRTHGISAGDLGRDGGIGCRQLIRLIQGRIGIVRFRRGADQAGQDMIGKGTVPAVHQIGIIIGIGHTVPFAAGLGVGIIMGGEIGQEKLGKIHGGLSVLDQVNFHGAHRGKGPAGIESALVTDRRHVFLGNGSVLFGDQTVVLHHIDGGRFLIGGGL